MKPSKTTNKISDKYNVPDDVSEEIVDLDRETMNCIFVDEVKELKVPIIDEPNAEDPLMIKSEPEQITKKATLPTDPKLQDLIIPIKRIDEELSKSSFVQPQITKLTTPSTSSNTPPKILPRILAPPPILQPVKSIIQPQVTENGSVPNLKTITPVQAIKLPNGNILLLPPSKILIQPHSGEKRKLDGATANLKPDIKIAKIPDSPGEKMVFQPVNASSMQKLQLAAPKTTPLSVVPTNVSKQATPLTTPSCVVNSTQAPATPITTIVIDDDDTPPKPATPLKTANNIKPRNQPNHSTIKNYSSILESRLGKETYTFDALKFDLIKQQTKGFPKFWCLSNTQDGPLLMYLGDTQKHVSRSIFINSNMELEVHAENRKISLKYHKKLQSFAHLLNIMVVLSKTKICPGPDDEILHCKKGVFESKFKTQKNRCLDCRKIRIKSLNETTEMPPLDRAKMKALQVKLKNLKMINRRLREKLKPNRNVGNMATESENNRSWEEEQLVEEEVIVKDEEEEEEKPKPWRL